MNSKIFKGLTFGAIAGVIDLVPMLLQGLTWDANLSAFSMWVVIGFILSTTALKMKGAVKGVLVSFLVILPSSFLIGWKEPVSLIPIAVMTLIIGSALGYVLDRK
ncbi:Uncharacterised protein [Candidatus Tiddalikarchaeum anstoanum]|nr:Uncharacterised protein [Candidatus Tiddalikarchaeum anstoanum]